jgi:hypothetical protein
LFHRLANIYQVKHLSGAPLLGRLLALPTNISLSWNSLLQKHSSLLDPLIRYKENSCEYDTY